MFTIGRQREKQHAVSYLHNEADTVVVCRVIDAAHDIIEGVAPVDSVAPVFAEAFVTGGGGAWEQTGSWIHKLAREYPSLHQLWLHLALHKSARIRFRVAAFLNDMPDAIRRQLAATFLADPCAKVRSKAASEIHMRPTPDMLPLLQSRLTQETDAEVINAIQLLSAYSQHLTYNHALLRTRIERRGCNHGVPRAGSLSLGRYVSKENGDIFLCMRLFC